MVPARWLSLAHKAAVERAVEIARAKGAKRAMLLPVSAPFHCALMQPAADVMAEALAKGIRQAADGAVGRATILAKAIDDPAEIVRSLHRASHRTVRWRESVVYMASAGVTNFYEVGAGKVLSGLIRRLAEGAVVTAVGSPEDVCCRHGGRN